MKRLLAAGTAILILVAGLLLSGPGAQAAPSDVVAVRVDCTNVKITYARAASSTPLHVELMWPLNGVAHDGPGDPGGSQWSHVFAGMPETAFTLTVLIQDGQQQTLDGVTLPLLGCNESVETKISPPVCANKKATFPWAVANTGTAGDALFELKLNDVVVDSQRLAPGQAAKGQNQSSLAARQDYVVGFWVNGQPYGETQSGKAPECAFVRLVTAPEVSGVFKVGRTVRVDTGEWSPIGASFRYRYQWYRVKAGQSTRIGGATKNTYRITPQDRGFDLTVDVTAVVRGLTTAHIGLDPISVK